VCCRAVKLVRHRQHSSLAEVGVKVVALSVDDEATGAALVTKHHLGSRSGTARTPMRWRRRRGRGGGVLVVLGVWRRG